MNDKLKKLYDERLKIDSDQKQLLETADNEKRGLTPDEETNYQNMDQQFAKVNAEIKVEETKENRAKEHERRALEFKEIQNDPVKSQPQKQEREMDADAEKRAIERRKDPIRNGIDEWRSRPEYVNAFRSVLMGQMSAKEARTDLPVELRRTLQADKDTVGGFLVVPEVFMTDLISDLKDLVWMRQLARNIAMPRADRIAWPILDDTFDDSNWTAELKTGSEDAAMDFEKMSLSPHPSAKRVKVSGTLIGKSSIDVEALVRAELSYKFGITEERAFLTGDGGGKPIGVFTAASAGGLGITTGRDVSTGNSATEIKADNLIDVKYSLKAQWRKNATWIFHRDAIKMIRKLKTGAGDYLWKAGISSDRPDTILDFPIRESEYAPSTFTTGLYVGILGDFSYYLIVTALDMRVAVLNELYAETNEIGYIGRMEVDGAPIRENAFVRVKLA
jgi:HK97 family phage major capsid protein